MRRTRILHDMRFDLDLAVGEQLGDDAGKQQVVGLVDLDGRRRLQPRGKVGQRTPQAEGKRRAVKSSCEPAPRTALIR